MASAPAPALQEAASPRSPHLVGQERRRHLHEVRVPQLAAGIGLPQDLTVWTLVMVSLQTATGLSSAPWGLFLSKTGCCSHPSSGAPEKGCHSPLEVKDLRSVQ